MVRVALLLALVLLCVVISLLTPVFFTALNIKNVLRDASLVAIAGIGMLTVGIVGGPLIGKMQEDVVAKKMDADTYASISVESSYLLGKYTAVDAAKVGALETEAATKINEEVKVLKQGALANITIFPI